MEHTSGIECSSRNYFRAIQCEANFVLFERAAVYDMLCGFYIAILPCTYTWYEASLTVFLSVRLYRVWKCDKLYLRWSRNAASFHYQTHSLQLTEYCISIEKISYGHPRNFLLHQWNYTRCCSSTPLSEKRTVSAKLQYRNILSLLGSASLCLRLDDVMHIAWTRFNFCSIKIRTAFFFFSDSRLLKQQR